MPAPPPSLAHLDPLLPFPRPKLLVSVYIPGHFEADYRNQSTTFPPHLLLTLLCCVHTTQSVLDLSITGPNGSPSTSSRNSISIRTPSTENSPISPRYSIAVSSPSNGSPSTSTLIPTPVPPPLVWNLVHIITSPSFFNFY